MASDSVCVLLADDHHMVREALTHFIKEIASCVSVLEAGTFAEANEVASRNSDLDLIILDLNMPGMNGLSGLQEIHARFPSIPVVILTGSIDPEDMAQALRLGAAGYIPKTMIGAAMVNALKLVLTGERFIPSELFFEREKATAETGERFVRSEFLLAREKAVTERAAAPGEGNPLAQLTSRQRAVLDVLMEGCSNKQIAKRLGVEEVTVKVHLHGIFKKLGVSNRTQAVRKAIELGWETRKTHTQSQNF